MKAVACVEDGIIKVVLTPESEWDRYAIGKVGRDGDQIKVTVREPHDYQAEVDALPEDERRVAQEHRDRHSTKYIVPGETPARLEPVRCEEDLKYIPEGLRITPKRYYHLLFQSMEKPELASSAAMELSNNFHPKHRARRLPSTV